MFTPGSESAKIQFLFNDWRLFLNDVISLNIIYRLAVPLCLDIFFKEAPAGGPLFELRIVLKNCQFHIPRSTFWKELKVFAAIFIFKAPF